ncbi:MAG: hypothetical protein JNJ45_01240 [Chthonomonas sp.]|nr:hypothetical protein [Chthonomonas sp.]
MANRDTQAAVLGELARLVPSDIPFLALGQTAFWDEPLKIGVADQAADLGFARSLVAGVHDTDYFAKLVGASKSSRDRYVALPHNDTTTRDLWSAAGEFSSLFGSETVVTREFLTQHGAKLGKLLRSRPSMLDQATEAFGWRGVVATDDHQAITSETPLGPLLDPLRNTFKRMVEDTLMCLPGQCNERAETVAHDLIALSCDVSEPPVRTLADYYENLLPALHRHVGGRQTATVSRTTQLLRINSQTAQLPRFSLVDFFLAHPEANQAYNQVVQGTEIYPVSRFGSWAIPFELAVPGHGRGTLRIAPRAVIIMTPKPLFISTKTQVRSVAELAALIERKFGEECTLIGKAVTLIGMLASEFVFMFHEGASGYVRHSRRLHQALGEMGWTVPLHPILRVKYPTWEAIGAVPTWLRLPSPLARAFGVDELCAASFAARLPDVQQAQTELLAEIARRPSSMEFIRYLASQRIGAWARLEQDYEEARGHMGRLHEEIKRLRTRRRELTTEIRTAKATRNATEHAKGEHWREKIFERTPTDADWTRREEFTASLKKTDDEIRDLTAKWQALLAEQNALVASADVREAKDLYQNLELEAEIKRVGMIRDARIVTKGLTQASLRPSAWWFPVVSPNGEWFRQVMARAEYSLEFLR